MLESALIIFAVFAAIYAVVVALDVRKARKHGEKYRFRQALTAFLFLLPATALAFFFVLLPILYSLGYSFTNYHLLKWKETEFVGFNNFIDVFKAIGSGGKLTMGIKNTAIFVVCRHWSERRSARFVKSVPPGSTIPSARYFSAPKSAPYF